MKHTSSFAQRIIETIVRPHESIKDIAVQAKSRLLAIILLAMTIIFIALDLAFYLSVPGYLPAWYNYALLALSFLLNRTGRYRFASAIAIALFPVFIFLNIATGAFANPVLTLNLTVLSIMLGSIILSRRGLVILTIVNLAGILAMPFIIPDQLQGVVSILGPAFMLVVGTMLAFLFMNQRDQIELARQAEISESRERLQMALKVGKMGAWNWDIVKGAVHWSEDVEAIFGLLPGQFNGTYEGYLSFLSDEERYRVEQAIQEALQNQTDQYYVIHKIQTADGEIRWLEGRGNVVRDKNQQPIRIVGTVMDITARLDAEAERAQLLGKMERRNARLNTATRVSKYCNSILDPELLIQQATDLIADGFDLYYVGLFLVSEEQALLKAGTGEAGAKMLQNHYFLPIDTQSMIGWCILNRKARIALKAWNDEVRFENPYLPETRSEVALPLISRNRVIGALTIQSSMEDAFDETDIAILQTMSDQIAISIENARLFSELQHELRHRLEIERELERERDFAVLIMSTLGQGVIVTDERGRLEYVNPAFARMIGLPAEQLLGKQTSDFVHADDRDRLAASQTTSRKTTSFEIRFKRANGQWAHVLITSSPRHSEDRTSGTIAAMIDLTERKQAEMEREALIRELEAKNAELERFTYTVSHDLKSPLITIRGFLGYLLKDAENGDTRRLNEDAKRIADATNRMQRLLDDLLELSRVGRLANPPEEIHFAQIVQDALSLVEGRLTAGGVKVKLGPRLPLVRVDRVRMVEAIQNLVDNAAKFMGNQPNPLIEIGVREDTGQNVFYVKDNGIGIDPKFHNKIFGLFDKLDPSTEGTGVGLALVKRIIEVHGGKIWLDSKPGQGTTFFFTLG